MAKITEYELTVRRYANSILESSNPETTISHYILQDLTLVGEKRIVNKLIHKYEQTISANNLFGFDNKTNNKVLEILNNRKNLLATY